MRHYTQLQAGRLHSDNLRLRRELADMKKDRDEWRRKAEDVDAARKRFIGHIEEAVKP